MFTMQKIILLAFTLFTAGFINAQGPVNWSFTAKKTGDKMYEIHLTASVSSPWHIYSQKTPEGGPVPTKISFNKNPLLKIEGEAAEKGKLVTKFEEVFDIDTKYFDGNVSFVQKVKVKANVKTNITGTIEFMACNEQQCMPPAEKSFSILLN